ncbi:MAG: hypothetical protein WEC35_03395 [Nitrosopumilaceae archaeon]
MPEKPAAKNQIQKQKTSKVSIAVFLATLVAVLISLVSVLFPALVASSVSNIPEFVGLESVLPEPFEVGVLAIPLVAANIISGAVAILYFKKVLPQQLLKAINFVFSFEVSKRTAFVVMIVLLAVYVIATTSEITSEETWLDYKAVKERVQTWTVDDVTKRFEVHVRYLLLSVSLDWFGNIRLLPFVASIALVVLVYYITKEIAKKRFAGLVAVVLVLQSNLFLSYDTSATYDNLWILLYLFSLYMIYKRWALLSPVPYILSIPSKALTALFIPMSLFFIYRADMPKKRKIYTIIIYAAMVFIGLAITSALNVNLAGTAVAFNEVAFWQGFTSMAFQLRFDVVVVLFLLPLIVGLFIASRHGITQADSIMALIAGILFTAPLLTGFTDQTNQPYRFVPLVVFFAMGAGAILSKRTIQA